MFCKKCGATLEAGAIFCPSCGAVVEQPPEDAPVTPESILANTTPVVPLDASGLPTENLSIGNFGGVNITGQLEKGGWDAMAPAWPLKDEKKSKRLVLIVALSVLAAALIVLGIVLAVRFFGEMDVRHFGLEDADTCSGMAAAELFNRSEGGEAAVREWSRP